jgi:hypothetical protein
MSQHETCDDDECDTCNPIRSADIDICSDCGEHATFRENTGSDCCGARMYMPD